MITICSVFESMESVTWLLVTATQLLLCLELITG